MSFRRNARGMTDAARIDGHGELDPLTVEIERYLAAVDAFRALGSEPTWRPEQPSDFVARVRAWLEPCEQGVSHG